MLDLQADDQQQSHNKKTRNLWKMPKNPQKSVDSISDICLEVGMETQNLDLLAKFADIVEELTTQELDEAWAIFLSQTKALSNDVIRTLQVGQPVMFRTRNRGDKYGTIEKVMRKRVKVRCQTPPINGVSHGKGELWTVNAGWVITEAEE